MDKISSNGMKIALKMIAIAVTVVGVIGGGGDSGPPARAEESVSVKKDQGLVFQPGNYTVKASLGLATEKRKLVSKALDLNWTKSEDSTVESRASGWVARGRDYFWYSGTNEETINVSLKTDKSAARITDFEEFYVDYQDLFPDNPSNLRVKITLSGVKPFSDSGKSVKAEERKVFLKAGQEKKVRVEKKAIQKMVMGDYRQERLREKELREEEKRRQFLKEEADKRLLFEREQYLSVVEALNIPFSQRAMKNRLYLIKRILHLPFDSDWYYSQTGDDAFFQRRLKMDLGSVETMDLVLQKDVPPPDAEKVNRKFACNLRVGFGNPLVPMEIVGAVFSVQEIRGRYVLRIELGDIVRHYLEQGNKSMFLHEIIVRVAGQQAQQVMERPLFEAVVFQEWQDTAQKAEWLKTRRETQTPYEVKNWVRRVQIRNEEARAQREVQRKAHEAQIKTEVEEWVKNMRIKNALPPLPVLTLIAKTEDFSEEKRRLVLDLRGLADQVGKNTVINDISLSVQPNDPGKRSGIHLRQAGMVKLMDNERPLFLGVGERLNRRWGGPFFPHEVKDEKVEWVKIDSYLPFENKGWEQAGGSISVGGGEIKGERPFSAWNSTGDGLEIEGPGKWVEVDWPIHARTGAGERFYLDVPDGVESIVNMRVESRHHGQTLPAVDTFPNLPMEINATEIDGIKIRLELDGKPFHITLKEMALFQPIVLTPAEALDIPQLVWEETPLVPADIHAPSDVQAINGRLAGTGADNVSWTTKVERKTAWIHGISIKNEGAWPDPCGFQLTLNFSGRRVERKICPTITEGQAYISASDLFLGTESDSEEKLESITWTAHWLEAGQASSSFDMSMMLDGVDLRSIRGDLMKHPVVAGNDGQKLFPTALANIPAEDFLAKNHWTNLGSLSTGMDPESQSFNFQKHPYLHVKKALFEKMESGPTADHVEGEPLPAVQPGGFFIVTRWSKFLLFVLAVTVLRREWKKDRLSSVGRWFLSAGRWLRQNGKALAVAAGQNILTVFNKTRTIVGKVQGFLLMLYRLVLSQAMMVNRLTIIIAFGLVFLTIRLFDNLNVREPVLWMLSLFLLCVLWHELRWRAYQNTSPSTRAGVFFFGKRKEIPWALRWVTLVAVGAAWRLRHGGNMGQIISETRLPLEFLFYLYLPWVERPVSGLWKLLRRLWNLCRWFWFWVVARNHRIWSVVALGFYVAGIFVKFPHSENYLFTGGSIAALLAWRSLMLFSRPQIGKRWPSVYGASESPYIVGFLLAIAGASLAFFAKQELVAEQFAVIGFYMLAISAVIKVRDLTSRPQEVNSAFGEATEVPRA